MSATDGTGTFEGAVGPLVPRLRAVARRLVADRALAEDAVQEALLRAYRFWDRRRGPAVWPWLRQVVIRECRRLHGRRVAQATEPLPDDLPAQAEGFDERAIRAQDRAEVRAAVERLPAGYRRVLRLRHGFELGEGVIAAIVGLPLGTVQWRLKRAHDHLRLVLTLRQAPRLAATLREVTARMQIRVTTERGPGPSKPTAPDVEWSGIIRYEPVRLDEAQAAIPAFALPAAVLAAHPDLVAELGRRGLDASQGPGEPSNISLHTPGHRLIIECHSPAFSADPAAQGDQIHCFPGAEIGVDEDTQVGGRPGHWTQVAAQHNLWWFSRTGAQWRVAGELPPPEIRRIAEQIETAIRDGMN